MPETDQSGPKVIADMIERALDFYADPSNHQRDAATGRSKVDADAGQRARDVRDAWKHPRQDHA